MRFLLGISILTRNPINDLPGLNHKQISSGYDDLALFRQWSGEFIFENSGVYPYRLIRIITHTP